MALDHTLELIIKVDGTRVSDEVFGRIEEVVVDDRLQLPATCTIRMNDVRADALEKSKAKIGAKLEVSSTPLGESAPTPLFTGEVTALEGDYNEAGTWIVIRAYDLSHRLQAGRHTEGYQNVTDADIARKIAGRHNIPVGTIDSTSTTFLHVAQASVSDWNFLKARAREIGYEVSVADGKFNFRKPNRASEAPPAGNLTSESAKALVYGGELLEFRPRLSGNGQVPNVVVRSWDQREKQDIVEAAPAATVSVKISTEPKTVASDLKSNKPFVSVALPVDEQAAAKTAAEAIAEEIASSYFEADGVAIGDPRLKAGTAVSISGVEAKFAGGHVLSHVRHIFSDFGYRTHFEISGRQERTLLGLASLGQTNGFLSQGGPPVYGLVVAVVTNIDDPDKLGRVKVKFPWLAADSGDMKYESFWARVTQFGAGPDSGSFFLPEVNDEVVVGFEHGDIHRPYIIGGLYNGKDKPDTGIDKGSNDWGTAVASGKVKRRGITSRKGHRFVFVDDDSGDHGILIKTSDGKFKIELKEKGGVLTIFGDPKIVIEAKQDIEIKAGKDVKIEAQQKTNLKAPAGVEMKSDAEFKIEGGKVDIKSNGPLSAKGNPIQLN